MAQADVVITVTFEVTDACTTSHTVSRMVFGRTSPSLSFYGPTDVALLSPFSCCVRACARYSARSVDRPCTNSCFSCCVRVCVCVRAIFCLGQGGMDGGGDDDDDGEEWDGDGDGEDEPLDDAAAAAAAGEKGGKPPPEWARVPTQEMGGKSADLV